MSDIHSPAPTGRMVGYARVSTKSQKLDMQIVALKSAGCEVIFTDQGVSGKATKRKGLSAAISSLCMGDTLVVHKIDRLGRNTAHLARLRDQLEAKGVAFRSISQGMDITSASGKLVYSIFAAFAEFESNLNGERTRGGLQVRKAKGVKLGRRLKLSTKEVQTAQKMLSGGAIPIATAASALDVSPSTLRRAIKRKESEAA
jgi:DNA invertase Pin-like site-specific DNA recombinase